MARTLRDMVVVITGASSGIGHELAGQLARRGARLVVSARRAQRLEALLKEIGGAHLSVRADVSKREDCERLIAESFERFGRIDTLVCNAGYGLTRPIAETTPEEYQRIFQTNVFGTTDCIRAAVPIMLKQEVRERHRGQIMIVSSAAARRGLPFFGAYAATKSAQLSIAEALRVELRHQQIAVTSVHPVGTETDFFTTAENETGLKLPPRGTGEVRQSVATVARKMILGIERPRTEVWPMGASRLALSLGTLMPGVVDRVMAKYRGNVTSQ